MIINTWTAQLKAKRIAKSKLAFICKKKLNTTSVDLTLKQLVCRHLIFMGPTKDCIFLGQNHLKEELSGLISHSVAFSGASFVKNIIKKIKYSLSLMFPRLCGYLAWAEYIRKAKEWLITFIFDNAHAYEPFLTTQLETKQRDEIPNLQHLFKTNGW